MADYRILIPRFFVDEKTIKLTSDQKIVFMFCVLGMLACSQTNTGIYEITRGEIGMQTDIDTEEVGKILDYFTTEKSDLMEYDNEHHVVHVRSFLKHNSEFLSTPQKVADAFRKDFRKTGEKCPRFWGEFGAKNEKLITKTLTELSDKSSNYSVNKKALTEILTLKSKFSDKKPSSDSKLVSAEKMQKTIQEIYKNS